MLASLFHGAQSLFISTLDWLNFRARDLSGQDVLNAAEASELHLTEVSRAQPTPKGSFEQVDRENMLDQLSQWSDLAPAPDLTAADTDLLMAVAMVEVQTGSDADLIIQFAINDPNGLTADALTDAGEAIARQSAFSPLIQPAVDVDLNETETASLLTISGTAGSGLEALYAPLAFSIEDAEGSPTEFDLLLGIWNTDLL